MKLRHLLFAGIAALQLSVTSSAIAQAFPSKPVRIVSAFSAGSGPDAMLRMVSMQLGKIWNQSVVVDNRPGGSGFIAVGEVKKAVPDGHTILHGDGLNFTAIPHMYSKLPYDAVTDFDPVSPIHYSNFFVTVPADAPWKSMGELLKAAKESPNPINYGSWQIGSVAHIFGALMERETSIKMTHVPFKDNSMLYGSVARGDVQWAFGTNASAGSLERAGKLRYLAIAAPARLGTHPNVPTVSESGGPANFEASAWVGLFAPKGTPAAVSQKIAADLAKAMNDPETKAKMTEFGYNPLPLKPEETRALVTKESQRHKEVVTRARITLD